MALEGIICLAAFGIAAGGVAALLGSQDMDDQQRRGLHPHYQAYTEASLFLDNGPQRQPRRYHHYRTGNMLDEDDNLFPLPLDDRQQRLWRSRRFILAHEPSRQPPPAPIRRYHRARYARSLHVSPHRRDRGEVVDVVAMRPISIPHVHLSGEEEEKQQEQQQSSREQQLQQQQQQQPHSQGGGGGGTSAVITSLPPLPTLPLWRQEQTASTVAPPAAGDAMVRMLRRAQEQSYEPPLRVKMYHKGVSQGSLPLSSSSKKQKPYHPHSPYSGPRLSRLMLAVFASQRASVHRLLRLGTEDIEAHDARGRTALWWACRWGETAMVRLLLRAGACERSRDYEGSTPRDAAKMGPVARVCLELLKEAERANLLWKVRMLKEKENEAGDAAKEREWVSRRKEGYPEIVNKDGYDYDEFMFEESLSCGLSWPVVILRTVPSPRGCWWIPGGPGSSRSSSEFGRIKRIKMKKVPRDVRAAVMEHVVGCGSGSSGGAKGLADDIFIELRQMLL
ncbi:hypothetical protein VYU27_009552 [Nannochloropsis oceanica]